MEGIRRSIEGTDGVPLGLLSAGHGPPLLLIHGGFGQIEGWAPMWTNLAEEWRVTAMDRRGRGSSGDAIPYRIAQEYDDLVNVVAFLSTEADQTVDVFAHSYGATVAIGAASRGALIRRLVAYEPPGPATVDPEWFERVVALIRKGRAGAAMVSFLAEILGLDPGQIDELKAMPPAYDILAVVAATLEREAEALMSVDLRTEARRVPCPITLLLGESSPPWAATTTYAIAEEAPTADVVILPGLDHEGISTSPMAILLQLRRALSVSSHLRPNDPGRAAGG